jgi:hypothetical protein
MRFDKQKPFLIFALVSALFVNACSGDSTSSSKPSESASASVALDEENFVFKSECQEDPFLTGEMKQYEQDLKNITCLPTLRYLIKDLPAETPKAKQTSKEELLPFEKCDLKRYNEIWLYDEKAGHHLTPNLVIQIIPFQTNDFPATGDPVKELSTYWKFLETSLDNMTDVESKYEVRIAEKYFKIDKNLTSFVIPPHDAPGQDMKNGATDLANAVLDVADKEMNFEDVNKLFFIGPPGTTKSELYNWGGSYPLKTDEGNPLPGLYISGHPTTIKEGSANMRGPMGEIHEIMHVMAGTLFDHNEGLTGGFGNMSTSLNDFLAWDKLVARFIDGEQVRCAPTDKSSTHWIKPSTINGKHEKLLMIPLSDHEAIAVESIRRSGFNFKLPSYRLGALVYTINTKQMDVQMNGREGIEVVSNPNKQFVKLPLLPGEFLDVKGYKITVLESGEFGDVVQVDKI